MKNELFTIDQFCALANIGRTLAYQEINNGKLSVVKLGRKTLIPRRAIEEWLSNLQPYRNINNK